MRFEPIGKLFLNSQHLGRLIDIFLPAAIAAHSERPLDRRARGDSVGLGEGDFMPIDEVAWSVIEVAFAGYHPAVGSVFPHRFLS
jgi:hypothetical protein